jgi:hypothetical protein
MAWTGCTTWDTSTTARTAIEQLLLSTAADRALNQGCLASGDRKIFLDTQYLEAYDKQYVISAVRERLGAKGTLVSKQEDAEVLVEVRSGGLAIDKSDFLFGMPSMPLPIPLVDGGPVIKTPELPLFKMTTRRSRAKLAMFATDMKTHKQVGATGILYGEAYHSGWVIFFVPFSTSDLWAEVDGRAKGSQVTVAPTSGRTRVDYEYVPLP